MPSNGITFLAVRKLMFSICASVLQTENVRNLLTLLQSNSFPKSDFSGALLLHVICADNECHINSASTCSKFAALDVNMPNVRITTYSM
jgi:hypothetical protein